MTHLEVMPAPGQCSRALGKYLSAKSSEAKEQAAKLAEKQRAVAKVIYLFGFCKL